MIQEAPVDALPPGPPAPVPDAEPAPLEVPPSPVPSLGVAESMPTRMGFEPNVYEMSRSRTVQPGGREKAPSGADLIADSRQREFDLQRNVGQREELMNIAGEKEARKEQAFAQADVDAAAQEQEAQQAHLQDMENRNRAYQEERSLIDEDASRISNEVDQGRYGSSMSPGGRGLTILFAALGGFLESSSNGRMKNRFLDVLLNNVDRDIALQEREIERAKGDVRDKRNALWQEYQRTGDMATAKQNIVLGNIASARNQARAQASQLYGISKEKAEMAAKELEALGLEMADKFAQSREHMLNARSNSALGWANYRLNKEQLSEQVKQREATAGAAKAKADADAAKGMGIPMVKDAQGNMFIIDPNKGTDKEAVEVRALTADTQQLKNLEARLLKIKAKHGKNFVSLNYKDPDRREAAAIVAQFVQVAKKTEKGAPSNFDTDQFYKMVGTKDPTAILELVMGGDGYEQVSNFVNMAVDASNSRLNSVGYEGPYWNPSPIDSPTMPDPKKNIPGLEEGSANSGRSTESTKKDAVNLGNMGTARGNL
jgi:hypothetical protein